MAEPTTSLFKDPHRQAMSLSAALRQAAVDIPKDLPPGVHVYGTWVEGEGVAAHVVVKAEHVALGVVWEQPYDGRGRRLTAGASITF